MSPETQQQDVNTEASSSSEQAVNDTAEQTATESSAAQETNEQPQEETQTSQPTAQKELTINGDLYDDRGVPWKNRAMELQRKFDESQANLPQKIAEEVAKLNQNQTPQKKYTIAELEKFAQENPEHRGWAEEEKARVLKAEIASEFEARMQATQKAQRDEFIRKQSFDKAIAMFPEIAIKDQQGNFIGWNNMSPMTQMIGKYMSNPELANRPDGLEVAAKLAYADAMLAKTPQTTKTIQSLKSQVRKAQAASLVEGSGKKPAAENPNRKLIDRVRESGRVEDAAAVMRNIFKSTGAIKE